ncbi:DUF485 domain-containing protein [Caballeronia sp. LZ001]|uniref:DUF485 domain-containing protein n=1 Tax=Caballeronia sp. LZ001 TaxID=3038553 RepID=UPI00285EE125|nr:DUF485 domain-containing protein [Caballeronia sp. LZ001]MDR5804778.1 DUF485 domain-containing protein [Caballeronia sp. LZ001]
MKATALPSTVRERKFAAVMLVFYGIFALLLAFFPDALSSNTLGDIPTSLVIGPAIILLGIVLATATSFLANRGS